MTWLEFMRYYNSGISEKVSNYILWNETAYPFSDLRMTLYQIRSSIRALNNNVKRCDACGMKHPFHKGTCLNYRCE